jgi:hypothetical protein
MVMVMVNNRPLIDSGSFDFENSEGDEYDTTIYM